MGKLKMKHICDRQQSPDLIIRGLEGFQADTGRPGVLGGQHCPPAAGFPLACRAGGGLLLLEKHRFAFKGVLGRAPSHRLARPHACGVQLCWGIFALQRPSGGEAIARSEMLMPGCLSASTQSPSGVPAQDPPSPDALSTVQRTRVGGAAAPPPP